MSNCGLHCDKTLLAAASPYLTEYCCKDDENNHRGLKQVEITEKGLTAE